MLDEVTCGIDGRFSTLTEASAECRAQGLQLCSLAEYEGCKRKGCHYDDAWAWVQEGCTRLNACTRLNSQARSRAPPARNCDGRNRLGGTAAAFYCAHGHEPHGMFCNRCDLNMQNEVLRAATAATAAAEPLHVFAVGTFDGADLERTARQPWFDSGRSTLHGWELQPRVYSAARQRMRALPEAIASRVRLADAPVPQLGPRFAGARAPSVDGQVGGGGSLAKVGTAAGDNWCAHASRRTKTFGRGFPLCRCVEHPSS